MAGLYDGIEEIPFKKTENGYVFKCANPWLIGPRRYYAVTEAQKVEIAACLRETMRRLRPFVFASMIVIPAALIGGIVLLLMLSNGHVATGLITLYALALTLGLFVPYFAFIHIYGMRRLNPLIADLPRSNERIGFREGTEAIASKISMKLLIVIAGAFGFGFIMNALRLIETSMGQHANASIGNLWIQTGFSAATAAYGAYLLILRLRAKRAQ